MHNLSGRAAVTLTTMGGLVSFVGPDSIPSGSSPRCHDVDFSVGSVKSRQGTKTKLSAGSGANFQYIKSFPMSNGTLKTLAIDSAGTWWVADALGELTLLLGNLPANCYAKSVTAEDREYVCFSDLTQGIDIPRQYTGDWVDRITQVGPGAPPVFTPQVNTGNNYAISTIAQPSAKTMGNSYFLQAAGPGSAAAGNVVTFYYSDATAGGTEDADLVSALNSGFPVYVYASFTGTPVVQGPYVVQVLSHGLASPPSQPHQFYYFTFNVSSTAYTYYSGSGNPGYTANYQRTLALLTTSAPVPGLVVGNQITINGTSVANYNSGWTISETVNSGAMVITQTSVAGGVATYSYSLSSGVAPTSGQPVTVTGTTNANGVLNVTNATITSASGGNSGTFTVATTAPNTTAASESGQATTAGTQFDFDPGAKLLGTATSPIYGSSSGGNLVFIGTAQYISPGTRQGVVFFGTRNDAETFPSIPVIFTIPTNTLTIDASMIPIGPPNCTYRQIAITEPGQNGQPGGDFYTIDIPVQYTVNGVPYTSNSFRIPNNTDDTIALTFRDSDLLAARRIDVQGQDLFNQVEIGNPVWVQSYSGRLFYGLTQSRIYNFINLSFDGGYLSGTTHPLGWNGAGGMLRVSPVFGNSYYASGSGDGVGTLTQTAYQDYYRVEIIRPNVAYSVRITARVPSGVTAGRLQVDLYSGGAVVSAFSVPFASMNGTMQTFSGVLTAALPVIPSDLLLRVGGYGMTASDYEIDRLEVFPTRQPINGNRILVSYEADPEGVDGDTGAIQTDGENTQPCYGAVVLYDLLYLLKDRSMYYTQDSSGDEPSKWGVHEVSNKAGACGPNAYDSGEEWIIMANRNGVYVFTGGEPGKVSSEIQEVWDAINWAAGQSIWVRNDVQERIFYIGVPLPTPNFWLPDAPQNATPVFPNVILKCSYVGCDSGEELRSSKPVFATQFGNLDSVDLRRKWSIDQIPCPYADFITDGQGSNPLLLGNGIGNSKIYSLGATNDDGSEIPWRYTTYGFGSDTDVSKYPQLGSGRKRWSYEIVTVNTGSTAIAQKLYSNRLDGGVQYAVPGGLSGSLDTDREQPLNIAGNRVFAEFKSGGKDSTMDLSQMTLVGGKDVFNAIRGLP